MEFQHDQLVSTVTRLCQKKCEGDYWDFKQEWWSDNDEMIQDILAFANTVHDRDCFIILGIDEKSYRPIPFQKTRKKQSDIQDTLSNCPFAAENIPEVSLHSDFAIDAGIVDLLIIHNSDKTPFYLSKPFGKLRSGYIYARSKDRNTAKDRNATQPEIENLWKKRFGLIKPPLEQFYERLKHNSEWTMSSDEGFYNIYRPEFSLIYKDEEHHSGFTEFYTMCYPDTRAFRYEVFCKYNQTIMRTVNIVSIDGGRFQTPFPKNKIVDEILYKKNPLRFFYFMQDSPEYSIQELLNRNAMADDQRDTLYEYLPLFFSDEEMDIFLEWLKSNKKDVIKKITSCATESTHFSNERFQREAAIGEALVELLEKFRNSKDL